MAGEGQRPCYASRSPFGSVCGFHTGRHLPLFGVVVDLVAADLANWASKAYCLMWTKAEASARQEFRYGLSHKAPLGIAKDLFLRGPLGTHQRLVEWAMACSR